MPLANMHMMITDGDESTLDKLDAALRRLRVSLITRASSGAEAFQKWQSTPKVVDCVLCEHNLAQGTGLQLLHAVRTGQIRGARMDICFILLAAKADPKMVAAAAHLDVSGFIIKPLVAEKLIGAIQKGRRRAIRADFNRYNRVDLM